MQHNARDPHRDHDHGRIYRITYPSRPLVEPAEVHGAPIETLLENLELHEYRSRYRTRRELRGRDADEVLPALGAMGRGARPRRTPVSSTTCWRALWVTWGLDRVDESLLRRLLGAEDHRARAAAVRVLRYSGHRVAAQVELLEEAAATRTAAFSWRRSRPPRGSSARPGSAVLAAAAAAYATDDAEPRARARRGGGRRVARSAPAPGHRRRERQLLPHDPSRRRPASSTWRR